MKTTFETIGDVDLLRIEGDVDASTTGTLCDLLVARARLGRTKLVVEIAEGTQMARPGVRGLVVAGKLMRGTDRQFAIVADPELGDWLHRVSFVHLLPVHHTRGEALAAMEGKPDNAPTPHPRAVNRTTPPTACTLPSVATEPF